jgi:Carboxypeptidase regulatory-like domain/TonB dependent receptor-like, beta-barrel
VQPIEAAGVCGIETSAGGVIAREPAGHIGEDFLRIAAIVILLCAFGPAAPLALGQQSVDLASISGRVTDQSGAVLTDAQVTARQEQTNVTTATTTDREGRFRLPYLSVGPYEIVVRESGFQDAVRHLAVPAGAAFELPVTLSLSGIDATVTVTADASVLEAARSQIAATVSEAEVRSLPMNGRNFLELALLAPGVSPTNVASTQLFPETSAVPGVTLSVASQRNLSNNFIVDGLSANDDAAGLSSIAYGVDAIEQFQVVTSGAQAELGRALGGYVNVVTKSGTNLLHGTVYEYLRDDRFNAANPLLRAKLPMNETQYGGSVGGPVVTNRTFYFANVEQRSLDQTGLTTISDANVRAINSRLGEVGYRGPLVATGPYPNPVDTTNVFGKIGHQVSGRDQLSVRYGRYDVNAENSRGAGGLNAPSASSRLDNLDQTIALSNTVTLSPRTVLETRAQFASSNLEAPATDQIGPAVSIAGAASFGTSSSSPTRRANKLYQVVNNLSHQGGAHAVRAGVDFLYNDDRITFPRARRGSYSFSSMGNFVAGLYNNGGFTQTFGASDISQTNPNLGVYVQDEWKLTPEITLNLGLRYDLQFLETIHTDTNNASPRAGVAWAPFDSRRTVIRGSAGLFFDRVPMRALANALLSAGNATDLGNLRQVGVSLSPTQIGAPSFPNILSDVVQSLTPVNLTTMDRNLQNAYSRQASVEVEQELGARATIGVVYEYLRATGLLMSINQNVPTCVASGTNNGCRPDPDYGNNSQYSAAGDSNYHGLHVSFVQRPAAWGHYRVSYTLSKSMNDVSEFFFSSPIDPFDVSKDWGRSDDDQRHRLVLSGTLESPNQVPTSSIEHLTHGVQLSAMFQAYSAPPLNITSGVTTIQGTSGRPIVDGAFIARNAGEGSDFLNLNVRLSRSFHLRGGVQLEGLVEGFNLTNHVNVLTRNGNFGAGAYPSSPSATFGQITAVGEPRAFQFGARVRF